MQDFEGNTFLDVSTSQKFHLDRGGEYLIEIIATFCGGSVDLQKLGPDRSTYLDINAVFDDGNGTTALHSLGHFTGNGRHGNGDLCPRQSDTGGMTAVFVFVILLLRLTIGVLAT